MNDQLDVYRSALTEKRSILTTLKARRVIDTTNIKRADLNDRLIAELEGQILELEAGIRRLEMGDA